MKIRIPDINDNESFIEGKQSIVLLGANGAGKTRMSVWIDENNPELNVHRISAQKSLDMPEYVSPTELKKAEDRFLYGTTDDNRRWLEKDGKRYSRWGNNPETHMLNDYQPLMEFLMTENFEKSIEYREKHKEGNQEFDNETKLEKIKKIWEKVITHRRLQISAGKIEVESVDGNSDKYNGNAITYLEQYTRDNADSVKGMPLCAEFLDDDKDIPYGHGLTGAKGNLSLFENSVQVGVCEDWSIEDIEMDGEVHRCLCATGYINENRYPNFVCWLEKQIEKGAAVYGSVEMSGTKVNDGEIIYEDGWKEKGRVPMVYDYIGYSIISITPADDAALVTAFEAAKNEFDGIFEEKQIEKCTANEFDVFGDAEKCTVTDDWGLVAVSEESQPEEKALRKAEYDRLIVAGLLAEERNNMNFDVFE